MGSRDSEQRGQPGTAGGTQSLGCFLVLPLLADGMCQHLSGHPRFGVPKEWAIAGMFWGWRGGLLRRICSGCIYRGVKRRKAQSGSQEKACLATA